METQTENRLTDMTGEEEWEGGMYGESKLEICIAICKIANISCMTQGIQTGTG